LACQIAVGEVIFFAITHVAHLILDSSSARVCFVRQTFPICTGIDVVAHSLQILIFVSEKAKSIIEILDESIYGILYECFIEPVIPLNLSLQCVSDGFDDLSP